MFLRGLSFFFHHVVLYFSLFILLFFPYHVLNTWFWLFSFHPVLLLFFFKMWCFSLFSFCLFFQTCGPISFFTFSSIVFRSIFSSTRGLVFFLFVLFLCAFIYIFFYQHMVSIFLYLRFFYIFSSFCVFINKQSSFFLCLHLPCCFLVFFAFYFFCCYFMLF